jgi:uncharacterized membrane protein
VVLSLAVFTLLAFLIWILSYMYTENAQTVIVSSKYRIESIDILRGLVMIIMALDHVRDYFHITAFQDDPLNLQTTTTALYFTRWITHFCAPVFVFLSGTSIYLQSLRKSRKELSRFLISRGLWLICAEFIIVSLAWSFNPFYNILFFQVIWAIGICMFLLGFLIFLPYKILLSVGLLIVLGHNALDFIESSPDFKTNFWWDIMHKGHFAVYSYLPGRYIFIVYPFIPWLGVMILGYCMGVYYSDRYTSDVRKRFLTYAGIGLIVLFIIIRYSNLYGDPQNWSVQDNVFKTFLSFINVNKYPPSLLFLSITIGPALLFLRGIENIKNWITDRIKIFGRVAFFYYIFHLYLIHLFATINFFATGHSLADAIQTAQKIPFFFVMPGEGYGLWLVYLIWILVILLLYPLCKWYNGYKSRNKDKKWLSYL